MSEAFRKKWAGELAAAQDEPFEVIAGETFERIRYGSEPDLAADPRAACPDCGSAVGTIHHARCLVERCARCGRQRLTCPCGAPVMH